MSSIYVPIHQSIHLSISPYLSAYLPTYLSIPLCPWWVSFYASRDAPHSLTSPRNEEAITGMGLPVYTNSQVCLVMFSGVWRVLTHSTCCFTPSLPPPVHFSPSPPPPQQPQTLRNTSICLLIFKGSQVIFNVSIFFLFESAIGLFLSAFVFSYSYYHPQHHTATLCSLAKF